MLSTLYRYFEPGSWLEAVHEILVGSVIGGTRTIYLLSAGFFANIIRPLAKAAGIQLAEGKREKVPGGKLKAAAVGLSRTGTFTIKLALEELGIPTLHSMHLYTYENEEIFNMWTEKIFNPAIEKKDPIIGRADLQLIADSGYQAVADMPACLFYEQILEEFPDCKFILMTRKSSEVWFRSWDTVTKTFSLTFHLGGLVIPTLHKYSRLMRFVSAFVNKDASYMTSRFLKEESIKENAIASYEEHNRRVRELIPPDQLLEFSAEDGWEPLCKFLEIEECPTTPFPKSNTARSTRVQTRTGFTLVTIFAVYAIYKLRKSFKKKDAVKGKVE